MNDKIIRLIKRYLLLNYPVIKVRDKKKFKRAILIDGKYFFKHNLNVSIDIIIENTSLVFGCEKTQVKPIILEFFNS